MRCSTSKILELAAHRRRRSVALASPAQAQGSWAMKAPVPAALNEVSVVSVAGKIHVIGGSVLGFTGPYHVEYDPTTDKWERARPRRFRTGSITSAPLS